MLKPATTGGPFAGKSVVLTGTLLTLKRRRQGDDRGGWRQGVGLSLEKTHYVIAGAEAGSKRRCTKARRAGAARTEFLDLIKVDDLNLLNDHNPQKPSFQSPVSASASCRYQGDAEGDVDRRRQAADPVRGGRGRRCGITDMIFVTGRNKRAIEDHFDRAYELENELERARGAARRTAGLDPVQHQLHLFCVRATRSALATRYSARSRWLAMSHSP